MQCIPFNGRIPVVHKQEVTHDEHPSTERKTLPKDCMDLSYYSVLVYPLLPFVVHLHLPELICLLLAAYPHLQNTNESYIKPPIDMTSSKFVFT